MKLAENGYIEIDTEQRTNVPFVYAAGDVTKEFAHQVVTAGARRRDGGDHCELRPVRAGWQKH